MLAVNLRDIEAGMPGISEVLGKQHYQACMCCLHRHNHPQELICEVLNKKQEVKLIWEDEFDDQIDRSWKDQEYCTEHAAICVSALMVKTYTDYTIIERSRKGTGIDYWLGNEVDILFTNARLEVSGIFKGKKSTIEGRSKKKYFQSNQSDNTNLPAYISIVEFSNPFIIFAEKNK